MSRRFLQRAVSILVICTVLLSTAAFPVSAERDFQAEIDALEDKIAAANDKKAASEQSVSELKEQINLLQEQMNVYNDKIAQLNSQIAEKDAVIAQYQSEIDSLQAEIVAAETKQAELEEQISGTYDLLSERLRAAYMAGETSTLEILLSATDFESFLTRLELVKRISEHDTALVADLQADIDDLNATKEKLDTDRQVVVEKQSAVQSERDSIAAARAEEKTALNAIASKQSVLEQKVANLNSYIYQLDENSAEYQSEIAALEREKEEYDRQKSEEMENGSGSISNGGSSNYPVSSKGMICPLQYPNVIISAGWNGYPGHKGIDFITAGATGNTYGKEIRAAADGVVYSAEMHYSWGYNVYINHGNGVYTRYAHCSKMLVSKGETVKQGQVIAYVGNTGNVSPKPTASNPHAGAHLHFEVWVNGTRVNPAPWLP
ncbi:MAG: murein hydrolase activator EnvC family protein [Candidatus Fimenecus sp.]